MLDLIVHVTRADGPIAALLAAKGIGIRPIQGAPAKCDRYVVGEHTAIDRKTVPDFLQAIADKRLFVDAIDLAGSFATPVIVIEGEGLYDFRAFHPNAVRGALSALVIQYGCSVVRTESEADTAGLIAMMATHEQQGVPEVSLHPKRKAVSLPDMQRRVVEMLPGVGLIGARVLLQRFGSVRRIALCTLAELQSVRGIGDRKARDIIHVLRADYESIDAESDVEEAVDFDPSILFRGQVVRVARQHVLFHAEADPRGGRPGAKGVLDLVYRSDAKREVSIVELKRDDLTDADFEQLRDYLDRAEQSRLLAQLIRDGYRLRGISHPRARTE
jgi:ERCC4-type nuclease